MSADAEIRRILLSAFPGCRIAACERLRGGVSARATAADLVLADATTLRVVVRRPAAPTRADARRIASIEHALLSRCAALGIAPKPLFLDAEAAAVGLAYVEGAPEFAPQDTAGMLEQMATGLARIHAVPVEGGVDLLARRRDTVERQLSSPPERPDASLDEPRVRAALAQLWPWTPHNSDVLLHGDYWPGNLLWKDGRLAVVLDWEEAELGDPLSDVAVARLDVLWAFGDEAMDAFTQRCRERMSIDWRNLARWDLCAALRPMSQLESWARVYADPPIGRPDVSAAGMRDGHRRFVRQALRSLGIEE